MASTSRAGLAGLVLAVLVTAASGVATACSPAAAPPTSISALADLGPLTLPDAPPGFGAVDDPAQTGTLTPGQVAELADDPARQQSDLIRFGYLDGYQRTYTRGGDTIYATVEQYSSAEGARKRFDQLVSEADSLGERAPFPVPDVPDAVGNSFGGAALGFGDVQQHQVLFPFDTLVVRIEATSDRVTLTAGDAVGLARTQRDLLEARSGQG